MNICIDVGNTTINAAVYENNKLVFNNVFPTYRNDLNKNFLKEISNIKNKINLDDIETIIYSSVVPSIDKDFISVINKEFSKDIKFVKQMKLPLKIVTEKNEEVGDDLIADLSGLYTKYGYPSIVADLGTASKILLIDKNGIFDTCLIMPGLEVVSKSLSSGADLLPEISFEAPKTVLAHNTVDAMNAGLIYGHADMIDGLIKRIEKELGYSLKKVLTGGNAVFLKDILTNFTYDKNLCIDGLNKLLELNK